MNFKFKLGAALDIFWPSWAKATTLPNNADLDTIRQLCAETKGETLSLGDSLKGTSMQVKDLHDAVLTALKQFGEYTFGDKGASEVMDIYSLGCRIEKLPAVKAAALLRSFAHSGTKPKRRFMAKAAEEIVLGLQEWDALFKQPGIEDLLNSETPELLPGDTPYTP